MINTTEKLEKQITKIKKELTILYKEYTKLCLIQDILLEDNNYIPENMTRQEFKKMVAKNKNILNRGCIDRIFLQHLGILNTINKEKEKNIKIKSKLNQLQENNKREKMLIKCILKELE